MAALESLVPTDLEFHLQMNSSRFETHDAMRAEEVGHKSTEWSRDRFQTKVRVEIRMRM